MAQWGLLRQKIKKETKKRAYRLYSPFFIACPILPTQKQRWVPSGKGFHRRKGLKSTVLEGNYVHDYIGSPS